MKTVLKFGGVLGVLGKPLASQIEQSLFHKFQSQGVEDIDF
jgi:hypothetical protein